MSLPSLDISGLSFAYGRRRALEDVTLAVEPGETVVLLGPNGAGKTTLFSLICGLFSSRKGKLAIAGHDIRRRPVRALSRLGIVFQAQTLDLDLTVRQNLRYFAALRGMDRREADERIAAELERFGMADRLDDKVRSLNGGHRRRVEIARAILHQPELLLLDEPTVGLDIPTRQALIARLHALGKESGMALFWATHLIDEVVDTDRVVILHRGRIVGNGTPGDLIAGTGSTTLSEAYAALTPAGGDVTGEGGAKGEAA